MKLTEDLTLVPVLNTRGQRRTNPELRLIVSDKGVEISISQSSLAEMGLDVSQDTYAQLLVSVDHIVIRSCDATSKAARRINKSRRMVGHELQSILHLRKGERFEIPVDVNKGKGASLVGKLPEVLRERARGVERVAA